jgi:mono/diheme cytochrome c family protein
LRASRLAPFLLVVAFAAGCGGNEGTLAKGDPSHGKQLFLTKCASCHAMADAGSKGTIGPNLDGALAGDKQDKFKESTLRAMVTGQISQASAPMPKNLVRGTDAADVAAYVAKCAASKCNYTVAAPVGGGPGGALYTSLGCAGCHSLNGARGTGPPLNGLYGSKVQLASGPAVKADDAYLLKSIELPDSQIVKGFSPGIMSSAIKPHSVPVAKAKQLVAFIKKQK